MAKSNMMIIVGFIIFLLLLSSSAGAAWYFMYGDGAKKEEEVVTEEVAMIGTESGITTATTGTVASSSILSSATPIQVSELDLSTVTNAQMTTLPPTLTTPNVYSYTIDVNVERHVNAWRYIFNKGVFQLSIRPRFNDTDAWRQLSFVHKMSDSNFVDIIHNDVFSPATYSKLTVVSDGTTTKVYVNGTYMNDIVNISIGPPTTGNWTWKSNDSHGYVKVKNFYWWNKALTSTEVSSLTSATTSGTSGYTVIKNKQISGFYDDDKYLSI